MRSLELKDRLERTYRRFPRATDWLMARLVGLSAVLMRAYRQFGSARLPQTTTVLREVGVFPVLQWYSEPLFNPWTLPFPLDEDRKLPGIDLQVESQLAFLRTLKAAEEITTMAWERPGDLEDPARFTLPNGYFDAGDAEMLYQFVRANKPCRIIEIGSGHSSKIAMLAAERNRVETGKSTSMRCIEPFSNPWLDSIAGIELIRTTVEQCSIDWATELRAGDLLFIDSSHMIRPQGDVLTEYLEILPQLASGVYIHVHDIFTPRNYPRKWLEDDVLFWNEQYLLEAILSSSKRYEVVAALNYLKHHEFEALREVCPHLTAASEPGSFYLRVQ